MGVDAVVVIGKTDPVLLQELHKKFGEYHRPLHLGRKARKRWLYRCYHSFRAMDEHKDGTRYIFANSHHSIPHAEETIKQLEKFFAKYGITVIESYVSW